MSGEVLIVGVLFVMLLAAASFYFFSRLVYTERKIGMLESILLDIKMSMEMEENTPDHLPGQMPPPKVVDTAETETAFYNSVLESVATDADTVKPVDLGPGTQEYTGPTGPTGTSAAVTVPVNYDAMSREELIAYADAQGLQTKKRMSKDTLITLLREAERNSSGLSQSGDGAVTGSLDGASNGAPLDMDQAEEVTL